MYAIDESMLTKFTLVPNVNPEIDLFIFFVFNEDQGVRNFAKVEGSALATRALINTIEE